MRITTALRQMLLSTAVFAIVMAAVVSVDTRVRARVQDFLYGQDGTLSARAVELAEALFSAARHQTIENAPLVVFAAAGAVLFVFMFKV